MPAAAPPSNGRNKTIELLRSIGVFLTPLLLVFITYLQLAEEQRAQDRWETPAFERVVAAVVREELSDRDLATRSDIKRLEGQITELSVQMQPITSYLIKRGIIE